MGLISGTPPPWLQKKPAPQRTVTPRPPVGGAFQGSGPPGTGARGSLSAPDLPLTGIVGRVGDVGSRKPVGPSPEGVALRKLDARIARNVGKIVPPSVAPFNLTRMAERFIGSALSGAVGGLSSELLPQTASEIDKQTSSGNKVLDAAVSGGGNTAGMLASFAVAPAIPIVGGLATAGTRYVKGEESGEAALADVALNVGTLAAYSKLNAIKSLIPRIATGAGISLTSDVAGKGVHGELPTTEDIPGMAVSSVIGGLFGLVGGHAPEDISAKSFNDGVQAHAEMTGQNAPVEPQQTIKPNATQEGNQPENSIEQHQGTPPGQDVRSDGDEIGQRQSEQAGGGNSPVGEAPVEQVVSLDATKPDEKPVETQRAQETIPTENGTIQSAVEGGADGGSPALQQEPVHGGVRQDREDRPLDTEGQGARGADVGSNRGDESLRQGEARTDESGAAGALPPDYGSQPNEVAPRSEPFAVGDQVHVVNPFDDFTRPQGEKIAEGPVSAVSTYQGVRHYRIGDSDVSYPEHLVQPAEEVPAAKPERPLSEAGERARTWDEIQGEAPSSARESILRDMATAGGRKVIGSYEKDGKTHYRYKKNGFSLSQEEANKQVLGGLSPKEQQRNYLSKGGQAHDQYIAGKIAEHYGFDDQTGSREIGNHTTEWTNDLHDLIQTVQSSKHARDILIDQRLKAKKDLDNWNANTVFPREHDEEGAGYTDGEEHGDTSFEFGEQPKAEAEPTEQPMPSSSEESTEEPQGREFGIRHEAIDAERERYGLPPREKQTVYSDEQAKTDAAKIMVDRPTEGARLVDKYAKEKSGAPTKLEYAILLHEGALRAKDVDRTLDDIYLKTHGGSDRDIGELQEAERNARQRFGEVADVLDKAGHESGLTLQARKLRADVDELTNANMTRQWEASKGAALDEAESARVKDIADQAAKGEQKEKEVQTERIAIRDEDFRAAVEREVQSRMEDAAFEKTMEEAKAAGKKFGEDVGRSVAENAKKGGSLSDLAARWHKEAHEAGVAGYTANVGFNSKTIEAFVKDGAAYILDGVAKIEEWSKALVKNLSDLEKEHIRPHLNTIFERSKKLAEFASSQHDKIASNVTDELTSKNVRALYRKLYNEHPVAGDMTVEGAKELNARVTAFLQKSHPDLTEDKVRDLFSGYGKPVKVSRKDDIRKMSEVRSINQKLAGIQSVEKGRVPGKSGRSRQKPTQVIRELGRQLNKALKDSGLETVDPEKELASWQQRRTVELTNQIEDIEKELRTGEASVRGEGVPREKTPDIIRLEDQLKTLKEERDQAFPEISQQQIADAYVKRAKIAELQYRERIAENDYGKRERVERELTAKEFEGRDAKEVARIAFEKGRKEFEDSAKTNTQKFFDKLLHYRRQSAVSGFKTIGRIFGADVVQHFLMTPTSMLLSRAPGLRSAYPLEFSDWMAVNKGIVDHGWEEIMKVAHNQASAMDEAGSGEKPGTVFKIHKMEKAPVFRAYRDVWRDVLTKKAQAEGKDIGNRNVIEKINKDAHYEAQHIITMQASFMAKCFNGAINMVENIGPEPGAIQSIGKGVGYLLRMAQPVVRVGANLAKWGFESTPQGMAVTLAKYGYQFAKAKRAGAAIDPVVGRAIVRGLALGSIGSIATVAGFVNHHNAGGLYVHGHHSPDGLDPEDVRELGPASFLLTHTALGLNYQYGALLGQLHDEAITKGDDNLMRNVQDFLTANIALANKYPGTELIGVADAAFRGDNVGRAIVRQATSGSVKTVLGWLGVHPGKKESRSHGSSNPFGKGPF